MDKFLNNNVVIGATACLIGLAIFLELQELNYHARRNRVVIVKPEPEGAVIDVAFSEMKEASDIVVAEAEQTIGRLKRGKNGRFTAKDKVDSAVNIGDEISGDMA